MPDQTITCKNCQKEFVFTQGEQKFYQDKNLDTPKLCRICRAIKKSQQKHPQKPNS